MSIWNMSHTIGYATMLVLTGFLVKYDWRYCFFVPSVIAVVMAILLLMFLRDTPEAGAVCPKSKAPAPPVEKRTRNSASCSGSASSRIRTSGFSPSRISSSMFCVAQRRRLGADAPEGI